MGLFKSKTEKLARDFKEEQLYAQAALELAEQRMSPGLWAKAFAESGGNEQQTTARYIKLRVEQLNLGLDAAVELSTQITPQTSSPEAQAPQAHSQWPRPQTELTSFWQQLFAFFIGIKEGYTGKAYGTEQHSQNTTQSTPERAINALRCPACGSIYVRRYENIDSCYECGIKTPVS